jgi:hypothetical protein
MTSPKEIWSKAQDWAGLMDRLIASLKLKGEVEE